MPGIAIKEQAIGTVETSAGQVQSLDMSHRIWAAGTFQTAGGDANEAIALVGCLATDIAIVIAKSSAASRYVVSAVAAADVINVVMSGDPLTTTYLYYLVLRAL